MTVSTVRAGVDTYVMAGRPGKTFGKMPNLRLVVNSMEAFMVLKSPAPRGSTIVSAFLVFPRQLVGPTAARNIAVQRTSADVKQGMTWNTRPGVTGPIGQLSQVGGPGTAWRIPITQLIQDIANGAVNRGFKVSTTNSGVELRFPALNAPADKPYLEVTWYSSVGKPDGMIPTGAGAVSIPKWRQSCDYVDRTGSGSVTAVQVQIDPTADWAGSDLWDSGTVLADDPYLDLATTSYPGLANGATTTLRMRVRDDANRWSDWSDPIQVRRVDDGTLTVTAPGPVVVDNNYAATPSLEAGTSQVASVGGGAAAGTVTVSTEQAHHGTQSVKYAATGSGQIGRLFNTPNGQGKLSQGAIVVWSLWVYSTKAGNMTPYATFVNAAGAGGGVAGAVQAVAANTWTKITGSWVVDAARHGGELRAAGCYNLAVVSGDAVYFDEAMIDVVGPGQTLPDYFDGGTAATADATYAWTGTPGASSSVKLTVDNRVSELTPPVAWQFSGTQTARRVTISPASDPKRIIHDTGKETVPNTVTTYTIPAGVLADDGAYIARVYVWDDVVREATAGDPPYVMAEVAFTVNYDPQQPPPTAVTTSAPNRPWVDLLITRSGSPDSWTVQRSDNGGVWKTIVSDVTPADVAVTSTTWRIRDWTPRPGVPCRYRVRAEVNGKLSAPAEVAYTSMATAIWLLDPAKPTAQQVMLGDRNFTGSAVDQAVSQQVLGSLEVVRTVQGLTGLIGSCEGLLLRDRLVDYGVDWETIEERLYDLKSRIGEDFRLVLGDLNIPVVIGDLVIVPDQQTRPDQTLKRVSFNFWQSGEHPYTSGV